MTTWQPSRRVLPALAVLVMISPFATDMYLPSMPELTLDLRTNASVAQLTITAFLIGISTGQLFFGPLSDRLGRKGPLVAGSVVCLLASVAAALAPSVQVLIALRFVQGFAGAAGVVIARAMVADLWHGNAAARTYSLLGMLTGMAPVVAPLAGGILAEPIGWRGTMWVLAGLTVIMLLIAVFVVRETHVVDRSVSHADRVRRPSAWALLRRRGFTGHAMIVAGSFFTLMGYISASPFILQNMVGLSPLLSGISFALNAVGMVVMVTINARLVMRHGAGRMLEVGLSIFGLAVAGIVVVVATGLPPVVLLLPMFVLVTSVGLISGNSVALAVSHTPEARGMGTAITGAGQFLAGAVAAPLVGLAGVESAVPFAAVALGGLLVAVTAAVVSRPTRAHL